MNEVKFQRGINPAISLDIGIWSKISEVEIYFVYNQHTSKKGEKSWDVHSSEIFYLNKIKPNIIKKLNDGFNKSIREIWFESLRFDVKIFIFIRDKEGKSLPTEQANEYRKFLKPYHCKMIKSRWKNLNS